MTLKSATRLATELRLLCNVEANDRHPHILYWGDAVQTEASIYISM